MDETNPHPDITLWYLASPYSDDDPAVMQHRFKQACQAAATLIKQEALFVFSPIVHSHPIAYYGLPRDWTYWQEIDLMLLECCDGLIVLMFDGWQDSKGVTAEIEYATEHNMTIRYEEIVNE